jgi:ribosomal protein S18 acetylase RimI-like enzyme
MNVILRQIKPCDVSAVTAIHRQAFPDSAITGLGRFAARRYYHWLLNGPHEADGWGAFVNGELAGFCFSGVWRDAEAGYVRANAWFLFFVVVSRPWLAMSPLFRRRIVLGLELLWSYGVRQKRENASGAKEHYGIQAIAVNPSLRRSGIGRQLMKNADRCARNRGFDSIMLTVHRDNERAINFYLDLGWKKTIQDGVWNQCMTRRFE